LIEVIFGVGEIVVRDGGILSMLVVEEELEAAMLRR
jgi:hypothetical protein